MRRAQLLSILDQGPAHYASTVDGTVLSIKRSLARWRLRDQDAQDIAETQQWLKTIKRKSDITEDQHALLRELYGRYRRAEAIAFVSQAVCFYQKRHRFHFSPETEAQIKEGCRTVEAAVELYRETIGDVEARHGFFRQYLQKRSRTNSKNKLGAFNLFIKDQWETRRSELQGVCAATGATSVMRQLSGEWNQKPEVREQYASKAKTLAD